jgi:hypothetical protein
MDWLKQKFGEAKDAITGALPATAPLTSDSMASKTLGAAPEPNGYTMTGGRRYKKRRGSKKARKTRRRSRR